MNKRIRQIVLVVCGIVILAGALLINKYLGNSPVAPGKARTDRSTMVFTKTVNNKSIMVQVSSTGKLLASNRMEIYTEVQGTMIRGQQNFKPGAEFSKGEIILQISSDDFRAGVISQRSDLQNLITAALPDLRLDFSDSYEPWAEYLSAFDINMKTAPLPEPLSDKEKFFITGRNIYSAYYQVKNAELTLDKYTVRAPFNGVLTEALTDPGSIVRPGQRLGLFIDPSELELEVSVSPTVAARLAKGSEVQIKSAHSDGKQYSGKVKRINRSVDPSTQTSNIYVGVGGKGLEEGMFVEATIDAFTIENAIEVDRSLLLDENRLFVVKDSTLVREQIEVFHYTKEQAVVRGLEDGDMIVTRTVPGAFPGMRVIPQNEKSDSL